MEVDEIDTPTARVEDLQFGLMPVRIVRQRIGLGGSKAGAVCGQLLGRPVSVTVERLRQRPVRREQIVVRQLGELVEDIMRTPAHTVFLVHTVIRHVARLVVLR
jgi:hypothetical protein